MGVKGIVQEYFAPNTDFCGQLVHSLPNNAPLAITVEDLYAITLLGVDVRPSGVRKLLGDFAFQAKIAKFLVGIPPNEDIWQGITGIGPNSDSWLLHNTLTTLSNVNGTTATKILCRKRPRLLPMVDSKVLSVAGVPSKYSWDVFRVYLANPARQAAVEALRPTGLSKVVVPTLPLLDAAIWMTGSKSKAAKASRLAHGLP